MLSEAMQAGTRTSSMGTKKFSLILPRISREGGSGISRDDVSMLRVSTGRLRRYRTRCIAMPVTAAISANRT
ncbi:MAG: hypothetical protein WKF83_15660 [Nocardioidaceae bacterium]